MVRKLCELGWLFKKVKGYVSESMDKFPTEEVGTVGQAFCVALQDEFSEHYKLLAVLEAQSMNPIRWFRRCCKVMKGGVMAGAIHHHAQHGDSLVQEFMRRLLRRVCSPLFEMVRSWVLEGELDDIYAEFFVLGHPMKAEPLWRDGYRLHSGMLPSFISQSLAQWILRTGKSINFLRVCCEDQVEEVGTVGQAFCAALQDELPEYYKLLAVLEAQSMNPIPMVSEVVSLGNYLSLRRLSVWFAEPTVKMRLMAVLVDSCKVMKGSGNKSIKASSLRVENQEGVANCDDITANSDAFMVARGDLEATKEALVFSLRYAKEKGFCKVGDSVVALHRVGAASVIKMLTVVGHGTRREVQESRKHQQREVGADDQSKEVIGEKGDDVAAENLQNTSHVQPRNG
ncbi:hypothetical protein IFM89_004167 [Coptis chinensis]|uniref:Gamma-tubulin complex component n=1 Tax=Coptis chinensis TaxID=261450 RepID=A0A835H3D4_9MAGN|nr:hypothetical protein IFM89_004167 [Coptis chinensis]